MTFTQQLITIGMVILGTVLTRFLPFLIFPAESLRPNIFSISERSFHPRCLACWSSTVCGM